jgi:hypothetical protein
VFQKISKVGGCGSFNLRGSTAAPGERKRVFRVRVFCVFFSQCAKLPLLLECVEETSIYR